MHQSDNTNNRRQMETHSKNDECEWIVVPDGLIEEFRMFDTYEELTGYRANLMHKLNCSEWHGASFIPAYEMRPRGGKYFSFAVYVFSESLSKLLIFEEHSVSLSLKDQETFGPEKTYLGSTLGFKQWLSSFAPKDWNDLLMIYDCYIEYVRKGDEPNWQQLSFTENEQLDAFLKSTRGLLFWQHQFETLVRGALAEIYDYVVESDINRSMWGCEEYLNGAKSKHAALVEPLRVVGTSLVDIVRERMLLGNPSAIGNASIEASSMANVLWNWRVR